MDLSKLKPGENAYDHPDYKAGLARTLAATPKTIEERERALRELRSHKPEYCPIKEEVRELIRRESEKLRE